MLRFVQERFRRFGLDLRRWPNPQSLAFTRARVLQAQKNLLVLDVGANTGQWASLVRGSGFKGRIISFEPVPEAFEILSLAIEDDPEWLALPVAIGEEFVEQASMNVASNDGQSSSFLLMTNRHRQIAPDVTFIRTIKVKVMPLGTGEIRKLVGECPVYLKADVQGAEESVLAGLGELWPQVKWVELETWLAEAYEGAPTFWRIAEKLKASGFELFAVEPGGVDKKTGQQVSVDCIWQRDL